MASPNQRPHGNRIYAEVVINSKIKFISRVKTGTATFLGLKPVAKLPIVKKRHTKGWKGTRSYTLLLAKNTDIGGHLCASVSIPVSPLVKFDDMYAWAYKNANLAGITTPWGITYSWKKAAVPSATDIGTVGAAIGNALAEADEGVLIPSLF
jgi:hypothetical protein